MKMLSGLASLVLVTCLAAPAGAANFNPADSNAWQQQALDGATITVDPLTVDFGDVDVGSQEEQIVTISNTGAVPVSVNNMVLSSTLNFTLDPDGGTDGCGSQALELDPGGGCTVAIVFSPDAVGTLTATLTLATTDLDNPSLVVTLTGTGATEPGGCGLGGPVPPASYLAFLMIPALYGVVRARRRS